MSLGRTENTNSDSRDVAADYASAYLAEYRSYKIAGLHDRAEAVAEVLRALGHEIDKAPVKERAVSEEPLEKAVEEEAPAKRRGRPAKTAE